MRMRRSTYLRQGTLVHQQFFRTGADLVISVAGKFWQSAICSGVFRVTGALDSSKMLRPCGCRYRSRRGDDGQRSRLPRYCGRRSAWGAAGHWHPTPPVQHLAGQGTTVLPSAHRRGDPGSSRITTSRVFDQARRRRSPPRPGRRRTAGSSRWRARPRPSPSGSRPCTSCRLALMISRTIR